MNGESWFGVDIISSSPLFNTSQAHPEPKRVAPAFANSSLNASKLPNLLSIASASAPDGFPPPSAERSSQKVSGLHVRHHYCGQPYVLSSGTASKIGN